MTAKFHNYARYYDLINANKAYADEATYVASALRKVNANISTVLELGSGTGRHGRFLASQGLRVHGVELSPDMVQLAMKNRGAGEAGSFDCEIGDVRSVRLDRRFDAVVALFHVVSYQISDSDVAATFQTASRHLDPGGLFLFDVWHGPAVLFQQPEVRTRSVSEGDLTVVRKARPELRPEESIVIVDFDFSIEKGSPPKREDFSERHTMRYFFPEEISVVGGGSFVCLGAEEMITGAIPSERTWAVTYLLQKR